MSAGIWTCGECGEDVDIDFDTPDVCCPVRNTPIADGDDPVYDADAWSIYCVSESCIAPMEGGPA